MRDFVCDTIQGQPGWSFRLLGALVLVNRSFSFSVFLGMGYNILGYLSRALSLHYRFPGFSKIHFKEG